MYGALLLVLLLRELVKSFCGAGMSMCMLDRADEREEDSESVSEDDVADVGEVDDAIVDDVEMYFGNSNRLNSVLLSLWWASVIRMMFDRELSQTLIWQIRK